MTALWHNLCDVWAYDYKIYLLNRTLERYIHKYTIYHKRNKYYI
jgi:hypothetical protein